tara:strand:+ start:61 stop:240 length:180 start_codon:yes stop_codon:yes gene_type:complete
MDKNNADDRKKTNPSLITNFLSASYFIKLRNKKNKIEKIIIKEKAWLNNNTKVIKKIKI